MPETSNNNIDKDINLLDETFDISQAGSYHLSIQTEPDRLSYCVFNTVVNKYIVLCKYPFTNENLSRIDHCGIIFDSDDLLRLKYKGCSHLWISPRSTLVPEHLFDPNEAGSYLAFNHGTITGEEAIHNYTKPASLYNVFSYPESLVALLRQYQPNVNLFHQATPLIESIVANLPSHAKPNIAIYFYSKYLDIIVAKNKELLFYNTFQINAPEDSIYYLVGVSNLFGINLLDSKLFYAGNFKFMPSEISILKDYVDRIVEFEPPNAVTYSHYISEQFRKDFINLFNLYGCEL